METSKIRANARSTLRSIQTVSAELTNKAIHLPSTYNEYVASNSASVSSVESGLRSLTYLIPGARFHDSELASESLNTFIQLLSIYHDHILKKRAALVASSPTLSKGLFAKLPKGKLSHHARYTTFWSDSSTLYTKIATVLKIAQYTELLWEMIARRRGGERSRWRVVVLLESFKAICRMILLKLTNDRPVISPPLPLREDFALTAPEPSQEYADEELHMADEDVFDPKHALGEAGVPTPPLSESDKFPILSAADPYNMPRTGFTLPTLPSPDTISSYLLAHVVTPDDVKPVKQLMHRLKSAQGQTGELLYILRPVIYALLMQSVARRYGYEGQKWKKNWTPWLAGITIEYFARQLTKRDLVSRVPGGAKSGLSALERDEFTKRGWNMAWWGMRGAFYENVTKHWIHGVAGKLKGKPILDLVGGVVEDYEFLWSTYHFSTSTM